jgi:hypothetical protein
MTTEANAADTDEKSAARSREPHATGAAAALEAGALLPMTLTPVVGTQRSLGLIVSGYDGAHRAALIDSQVEATIWGPFAVRAGALYEGWSGVTSPFAGVRAQVLHQDRHGIDLGISSAYRPKDFRSEGNIVTNVMLSRRFDRLGLFASTGFESDPEGDDRTADVRASALWHFPANLFGGLELRFRRDLKSEDAKRYGHSEPIYEFRAAPVVSYAIGPISLIAQAGVSLVQNLNAIGTPAEKLETRAGAVGIGGIGGAL